MSAPRLSAAIPVLPVRDVARAAAFYRDRLGFRAAHVDDGYGIVARDDVEIHLWAARDETWRQRPDRPLLTGAETFLAGTASARIHSDGIDALYDEMRGAGAVHPNGPLSDKPYGLREFAVLDLDGNLVTFFTPIAAGERTA